MAKAKSTGGKKNKARGRQRKDDAPVTERVDFSDLHKELDHIWAVLDGVRVRKGKQVPERLLSIIAAVENLQDETDCQTHMIVDL